MIPDEESDRGGLRRDAVYAELTEDRGAEHGTDPPAGGGTEKRRGGDPVHLPGRETAEGSGEMVPGTGPHL